MTSRTPVKRGDPGQQFDPLLGGQPPHVPDEDPGPARAREQRGAQLLAAPGRVEALGVHAAAPQPHVADALGQQPARDGRRRCQGPRRPVVDAAQPPPGERLARAAQPVRPRVGRQVGLVHRDRGQAEPPGRRGAVRAEEHRAGQVDDLRPVLDERITELRARQPEPEARIPGQRHRPHPDHRERGRDLGRRPSGGLRRDDERPVTAGCEQFGHPQDAVRHPVHVGRKRLGNDRDPHGHKVRYQTIKASQPS
jgi:hypothetical protein